MIQLPQPHRILKALYKYNILGEQNSSQFGTVLDVMAFLLLVCILLWHVTDGAIWLGPL